MHFGSLKFASTKCYETYTQNLVPQNSDQVQINLGSVTLIAHNYRYTHGASSVSHGHIPHLFLYCSSWTLKGHVLSLQLAISSTKIVSLLKKFTRTFRHFTELRHHGH